MRHSRIAFRWYDVTPLKACVILFLLLGVLPAVAAYVTEPVDPIVVCDSGGDLTLVDEPGQYGTVTEQVCYRETFTGSRVRVRFVD